MLSAKPHKGHFERQACYPDCAKYTGERVGIYPNLFLNGVDVSCERAPYTSDEGEITGPKTGTDIITLKGCHVAEDCKGISQPAGEVSTVPLDTELIEPSKGTIQTVYKTTGGASVTFFCGGVGYYEVFGSIAANTSENINVMSTHSFIEIDPRRAFSKSALYFETEREFEQREPTSESVTAEMEVERVIEGAPVEINTKF